MRNFLFLSLALAACTTTTPTSSGQLVTADDRINACDDDSHASACGTHLAFDRDRVTSNGVFKDGGQAPSGALAALTPDASAELGALVAQLPLDTPDTIAEEGCGGPAVRSTSFTIAFDDGEVRQFDYQYGSGVAQQLDSYITMLVGELAACSGSHVTFEHCVPNAGR